MEQGVDGFRVDAPPYIFETEDFFQNETALDHPDPNLDKYDHEYYTHHYSKDLDETYDMLAQWRQVVDDFPDDKPRVIMTESITGFEHTMRYYGMEDKPGAHFTFNFALTGPTKSFTATDYKDSIDRQVDERDGERALA